MCFVVEIFTCKANLSSFKIKKLKITCQMNRHSRLESSIISPELSKPSVIASADALMYPDRECRSVPSGKHRVASF